MEEQNHLALVGAWLPAAKCYTQLSTNYWLLPDTLATYSAYWTPVMPKTARLASHCAIVLT